MARATAVNSTFTGSLNAGVSIGDGSCVLASIVGIDWASSGTFAVQVGTDPDTDAETVQVTRSGANLTLAGTFTKNHSASDPVYLVTDANDVNNKANLDSANTFTLGQLFPDGSASSNALARSADVTTGINFAANTVAISAAGTNRFSVSSTVVTTTIPIRTSNGTAGAPTHSFTAQAVSGMYAVGSNRVGISTNSTLRFDINTARVNFALPPVFATGAIGFGQLVIAGGGTTTNIATTDPSRLVVDTTGAGETLQWYATSSAQEGATYLVIDAYNNAAANNIVITDNAATTIGTINTNGGWAIVSLDFTNGVINCKVLA